MLLFLNKNKKIYSPCLVSVVHLAYFVLFGGVFRCLSQLSIDEVKAGHCYFERPGPSGRYFTEIRFSLLVLKRGRMNSEMTY